MAALLALLSSAMWGSADYLAGRLSRTRPVLVVLAVSQLFGLAAMLVAATVTGAWAHALAVAGWAVLASLAGATGLGLYYRALATGVMGVVSPIAALGVLVPLVAGVLAGERPAPHQSVGIVLALAGVVLASGPEIRGATGWPPVALAAGSAGFLGMSLLFIARGSEVSVVMTMTGMRLTSAVLLVAVLLLARRAVELRVADLPALAAVGVLDVGANLAFGAASTLGLLSLVAVFGSLYPVATIVLARWLDHERLRKVQQVGVALALVGVAAISVG